MNDADQTKLAAYIAEKFHDDPVGYCRGVLGFSPDAWQGEVLGSIQHRRRTAVRSGHGVGKTRLAAAVIHWFMATRGYPRIRCTANTEKQIMSVLWTELAKVNREAKNKDLFTWSRTRFFLNAAPEVHWAEAVAWSEENSEAFAGIHEENVLYIFDEASAIPDVIWEVSQGAMTSGGARWLVLGNPTRNTGKFHECFGSNSWKPGDTDTSRWHAFTVSCFDANPTRGDMPTYIAEIEREYGKDSDPYRVRVLGLPPLQESQQFIPVDLFETALFKSVVSLPHEPRILICDPARFGDDRTAIGERKGRNAQVLKVRRGQDTMLTVGDLIACMNEAKRDGDAYDFILVDEIGIGAGIVDRLREQGYDVIGVNVSESPRRDDCKNLTAELWLLMKEWLKEGHVSEEFREDLIGRQYSFDSSGRLVMERKEDMKKRGLNSPDLADMLALSFYPLNPIKKSAARPKPRRPSLIRRSGVR